MGNSEKSWLWRPFWMAVTAGLFALFAYRAWMIPDTDFVAYYNAGARAAHGGPLYPPDPTPFKYLPVVAYAFIPFSWLHFRTAKFVFCLISLVAGFALYRRVWREQGNWITLVLLASCLRFHNYDFLNAQVNHILLLVYWIFLEHRRSAARPSRWLASGAFAVLACFKIMPLILLAPLAAMRSWGEISRILLALLLFNFVPLLTYSAGSGVYAEWYTLLKATTPFPPIDPIFQSLPATVWHWGGEVLGVGGYRWVTVALQLLLLLGCVAAGVWARGEASRERAALGAAMGVSIVASPLAWKHNYLLLWPSIRQLLREPSRTRGALIAQFLLLTALPAALAGIGLKHVADRSYVTVAGALVLYVALLSICFRRRPSLGC